MWECDDLTRGKCMKLLSYCKGYYGAIEVVKIVADNDIPTLELHI
jgi:hypothetical protein